MTRDESAVLVIEPTHVGSMQTLLLLLMQRLVVSQCIDYTGYLCTSVASAVVWAVALSASAAVRVM